MRASMARDEGRRVLKNAISIGAFVFAPLNIALMSRALGGDGYGRWWSTYAILEAIMLVGMLAADLFVRRELPKLDDADAQCELVGSALAVACGISAILGALQLAFAPAIASAYRDPALLPYLLLLAVQPLLWNATSVLAAALQSRHVLGPVAILRGLLAPTATALALLVGWRAGLSASATLVLLLAASATALVAMAVIYARHFSLARTLRLALAPRRVRATARFGLGLLLPSLLFSLGGKLDIYVLGGFVPPLAVGTYAGCLQAASMLPNVRALFDPIAQHDIGELSATDAAALGASLRRLARICAFALAPVFIALLAVGEPMLALLLGRGVGEAVVPLAILGIGQLVGSYAVASWLTPMMLPGRVLAVLAAVQLAVKLGLLLVLVPRLGLVGASIATSVGTVMAMQGQAYLGARRLGAPIYTVDLLPVLVASGALAYGGRQLYVALAAGHGMFVAGAFAGGGGVLAFAIVLPLLLTAAERDAARARWVRARHRAVP